MMRAIDKGLANSRIGLVLVTPSLLARLPKESVADEELSALLVGNQLVPIVHNTTYEALRNASALLASRSGLDTPEDSMTVVAAKIAELVALKLYCPHRLAILMRLFGKMRSNPSVSRTCLWKAGYLKR